MEATSELSFSFKNFLLILKIIIKEKGGFIWTAVEIKF
jgi:hypothetical protein